MNLPEKVNSEITAAMKAKNEPRLRTYRFKSDTKNG